MMECLEGRGVFKRREFVGKVEFSEKWCLEEDPYSELECLENGVDRDTEN